MQYWWEWTWAHVYFLVTSTIDLTLHVIPIILSDERVEHAHTRHDWTLSPRALQDGGPRFHCCSRPAALSQLGRCGDGWRQPSLALDGSTVSLKGVTTLSCCMAHDEAGCNLPLPPSALSPPPLPQALSNGINMSCRDGTPFSVQFLESFLSH